MDEDSRRRGYTSGLTDRRIERGVLDQLVGAVRAGGSRVLVVRGEPGVGKSALLDYLTECAAECRVVRATGVQSEMELAFAGLHQLLAPMLDHLERLPGPQREALRTAFGLSTGPAPDRFVVGLAVLGLVSEAGAERPLICVVDDEQWLDRSSVQALGFVAGGWRPIRWPWCSRLGRPAWSWPGCRSSWSKACGKTTLGHCWTRR
jgi:hypothetical protein